MRCQRCQGLIVTEHCLDGAFIEGLAGVREVRCVNCGAREYAEAAQKLGGFALSTPRDVQRRGMGTTA